MSRAPGRPPRPGGQSPPRSSPRGPRPCASGSCTAAGAGTGPYRRGAGTPRRIVRSGAGDGYDPDRMDPVMARTSSSLRTSARASGLLASARASSQQPAKGLLFAADPPQAPGHRSVIHNAPGTIRPPGRAWQAAKDPPIRARAVGPVPERAPMRLGGPWRSTDGPGMTEERYMAAQQSMPDETGAGARPRRGCGPCQGLL
jgi:hypothetical protein